MVPMASLSPCSTSIRCSATARSSATLPPSSASISHATPHAEIGLTKFAVDRFREEGISVVTLGLSPLVDIEPSGFAENQFWRNTFQRAYDLPWVNRRRFNLQGQAAFKRRFHGIEEPAYIAFRKGTCIEMLGLLRLIKAI